MGSVNQTLPDFLTHSHGEVVDVERAQLHHFVVDLVSTLCGNLNLHSQVLDFNCLNAARNKPQARSLAYCYSVYVNAAHSQN